MGYWDDNSYTVERVLAFDNKRGWRRITPEEAAIEHTETVRGTAKLFKCECCGSYVLFTAGTKQARHFRHMPDDPQAKNCPQHSYTTYLPPPKPLLEARTAPIKLQISGDNLYLSIGLRSLPANLYNAVRNSTLEIDPSIGRTSTFALSERLYQHGTSFFDNIPLAFHYNLNLTPKDIPGLEYYWPSKLSGISDFAFFDAKTLKMVPEEGNIIVNREYYYLCRPSTSFLKQNRSSYGTSLSKHHDQGKLYNNGKWRLYRFAITDFTPDWADLFKNAYNRTLSLLPPLLYPIWPPNATNGDVLTHNRDRTYLFVQGSARFESFPNRDFYYLGQTQDSSKFHISFQKSIISAVNDTRKVFSLGGQENTIKQIYYFRDNLANLAVKRLPEIKLVAKDQLLTEEFYKETPKRIQVTAPWDGRIDVKRSNRLIDRIPLKAEVLNTFKPEPGTEYYFYQGADLVRKLAFEELLIPQKLVQVEVVRADDEALLRQLEKCRGLSIPISHSAAGVINAKMNGYPLVKSWFFKTVRTNRIPQDAWALIKKNFG